MIKAFKPWIICLLAAIFYWYEYLLRVAPNAMTAELMATFQISAVSLGNLSAYYYYAYAPMQLPAGIIIDRYGAHKVITFALSCCVLGTFLFATSSLFWASVGRYAIGFGSAFAFILYLKLAADWLPHKYFAMMAGLGTTLGMLGAMFGSIFIADMVEVLHWQPTLYYFGFFGLVLLPFLWFYIEEKREHHSKMTLRKLLLSMLQLMRRGQIWLSGSLGCLLYLSTSVFAELWGGNALIAIHHLTKKESTVAIALVFFGWAVGGPLAGLCSDWLKKRVCVIQFGLLGALVTSSVVLYYPHLSWIQIACTLFAFGVLSSVQVLVFALSQENCQKRLSATAVAFTNFIIMLGGVVFQPFVGLLLDLQTMSSSFDKTHYTQAHYQVALTIIPVGLSIGLILTFFLKETYCQQRSMR